MNKAINIISTVATVVVLVKLDAYHNPYGRTAKLLKKLSFKKKSAK